MLDEAANLTTHGRKRQRGSNEQLHVLSDKPQIVAGSPIKSIEHVGIAPLVSASAVCSQSPHSSNIPTNSWSPELGGISDTTAYPSFDIGTTEQVNYGCDVPEDNFAASWQLIDSDLMALPFDGQTEACGVRTKESEHAYPE